MYGKRNRGYSNESHYLATGISGLRGNQNRPDTSSKQPKGREEIVWQLDDSEDEDSNDRELKNEIDKPKDSDVPHSFLLTRTGKKELHHATDSSVNGNQYFKSVIKDLSSRTVLDHLKSSPAVGYIIDDLVLFISEGLKKPGNGQLVFVKAIHYLLLNCYIPSDVYISAFTNALVTFLMRSQAVGRNHYLLKDIAADVLSEMFYKHFPPNVAASELSKVFSDHQKVLDEPLGKHQGHTSMILPSSVINGHYGAVVTSLSMGAKALPEVIPHFSEYYKHASDMMISPSKNKMLKVWDKILACYFMDCSTSKLAAEGRYNRFREEKALCFPVGLIQCKEKRESEQGIGTKEKQPAFFHMFDKVHCSHKTSSTDIPSERGDIEEFSSTEVEFKLQNDEKDCIDKEHVFSLHTSDKIKLEVPETQVSTDICSGKGNLAEFNSTEVEPRLQNDEKGSVDEEQALSPHTSDDESLETLVKKLQKLSL